MFLNNCSTQYTGNFPVNFFLLCLFWANVIHIIMCVKCCSRLFFFITYIVYRDTDLRPVIR